MTQVTEQQSHFRTCQHCGDRYDWRKSPSGSLKMTYCGSFCELVTLGFTIEGLINMTFVPTKKSPKLLQEAVHGKA